VNTQEYILSGIVESYVLGLSSSEEKVEFEKMCALYPEVLAARKAFELMLEKHALENAITLPEEIRQKVMAVIESGNNLSSSAKVITMSPDDKIQGQKFNWIKYVAAACFILLAGSIFWNISLYNKKKQIERDYSQIQDTLRNSNVRLAQLEHDAKILQQNPNIKMAAMHGTAISPASYATVYWDTTSKDVYLMVNNLPVPASDKQYQLWALLDGKPIDMGVIDMNDVVVGKKGLLFQMKNAQDAQAFAISLEKKGGSPTPTMEALYVMGKL
jgi:anti-sigma-K factor RskA